MNLDPWETPRQRQQRVMDFLLDTLEAQTGIDADKLDPSRRDRRIVQELVEHPERIHEILGRVR